MWLNVVNAAVGSHGCVRMLLLVSRVDHGQDRHAHVCSQRVHIDEPKEGQVGEAVAGRQPSPSCKNIYKDSCKILIYC